MAGEEETSTVAVESPPDKLPEIDPVDDLEGAADLEGTAPAPEEGETKPTTGPEGEAEKAAPEAEAKEPAEPEKPAGEEAAEEQDVIAPLLPLATELGMSEDDARQYETPERLQEVLALHQQAKDGRAALAAAQAPTPAPAAPEQAPAPKPEPAPTAPTPAVSELLYKLNLNPEEVEPEIIKALEGMNQHYADHMGKMGALMGELADFRKGLDRQSTALFMRSFDGWVNGLPAEWDPILGKGSEKDVNGTAQWQGRRAILQTANQLIAGRVSAGEEYYGDDNVPLFEQACLLAFPKHSMALERAKGANTRSKRLGQSVAKPTGRRVTKARQGKQAAMEAADKFSADAGVPPDAYDLAADEDFEV